MNFNKRYFLDENNKPDDDYEMDINNHTFKILKGEYK